MPISPTPRCSVCSRPLTLHQWHSGRVCGDWRCRERVLRDALLAHRAEAARSLGVERPEAYPITVVPSRVANPALLPAERRRELKQFLAELLAGMTGADCADPHAETEPAAGGPVDAAGSCGQTNGLLAAVCAVCRGFCCLYGGARHAFIDARTLADFRARHPEMFDEEAAAAYLGYLPLRTYEDSCVYHTEAGCALPRAMRARICNAYECRGLREARQDGNTDARACVVVRHDNRIVRSAFVDASGIRSYESASTRSSSSP